MSIASNGIAWRARNAMHFAATVNRLPCAVVVNRSARASPDRRPPGLGLLTLQIFSNEIHSSPLTPRTTDTDGAKTDHVHYTITIYFFPFPIDFQSHR
jgi:hypothetical protein